MDISIVLNDWPYDEEHRANNIRKVAGIDGKLKLQVRLRNGIIQWDADGRPDGQHPYGFSTVLHYCEELLGRQTAIASGRARRKFRLAFGLIEDLHEEMRQFGQRRRAFLKMGDFGRALRDAEHGIRILEIIRTYGRDYGVALRLEGLLPCLLLDRARSAASLCVQQDDAENALKALNRGIRDIERFMRDYGVEKDGAGSKEKQMLIMMRRSLREKYDVPLTDEELLDALRAEQEVAIQEENYELAGRLRDKINSVLERLAREG